MGNKYLPAERGFNFPDMAFFQSKTGTEMLMKVFQKISSMALFSDLSLGKL